MRDYRLVVSPRVAEELRELTGFSDEAFDANFLVTPDLPDALELPDDEAVAR